ncbi:MAG: transglutaminase family protein [Nitriliruptoraceae bacterium]
MTARTAHRIADTVERHHLPVEVLITRLTVRASIDWTAEEPSTALLLVRVGHQVGQTVLRESVDVDGAEVDDISPRWGGARPLRLHLPTGGAHLRYAATVDVEGDLAVGTGVSARLPTLEDVDIDLFPWTLPSRYCPSDLLAPTAEDLFGDAPRTGLLLEHVRHWVERNIEYAPGTSNVNTGADETMLQRTGVCRDLAHLAATLLRALGVPARLASAYALGLEHEDFHAVVEAHDGTAWRTLDPTGLAAVGTLARIATGRDAADIAWGTTQGTLILDHLEVAVARA